MPSIKEVGLSISGVGDVRTYRRTRPRAMPLAMVTMKTQVRGFPISLDFLWVWGSALRPFGPPWSSAIIDIDNNFISSSTKSIDY